MKKEDKLDGPSNPFVRPSSNLGFAIGALKEGGKVTSNN